MLQNFLKSFHLFIKNTETNMKIFTNTGNTPCIQNFSLNQVKKTLQCIILIF